MAQSVRLNDEFVDEQRIQATAVNRSLPKQIEYVGQIGQIVINNPDLSYTFIKESLLAKAEMDAGHLQPYKRRTRRNG
ncbi:MAG: hypothetical protein COA74_15835 [Gammaproteobacteria bacterium]|nr:MAG: hypothetical protein COA74_15835 [Gammaproteobacteria bacterium]